MTTSTASFARLRLTKTRRWVSKTSGKTIARRLSAEPMRGTDGLTDEERAVYAQRAKSIHNSLPAEDLEKAFARLSQ